MGLSAGLCARKAMDGASNAKLMVMLDLVGGEHRKQKDRENSQQMGIPANPQKPRVFQILARFI